MLRRVLCLVLCLIFAGASALAYSRDDLRASWQQISQGQTDASPYLEKPDPQAFLSGSLTDQAQQNALAVLNFLRGIAGLDAVVLSPLYTLRAQNGAMLLAANDFLEHDAPQPAGMDAAQYESAHLGTSQGNIAKFNWMRPEILIDGVTYFARDDGEENLSLMGHRRWLLNPEMQATGFGLANSASGMSYVTMYAVDDGNAGAEWDCIAWPCGGAFPVEMMRSDLAWTISLNEKIYDLEASRPMIRLREENSGKEFSFDPLNGSGDGFCTLSREHVGSGACIIFRPEIVDAGIQEYVQNQIWNVEITGLKLASGEDAQLSYTCEMVSLYVQEVANIEISQLEAELAVGETLQLGADVIPAYADDLSIIWGSSDPSVASVDAEGLVQAVGSGSCQIFAMGGNGKKDGCSVTVK